MNIRRYQNLATLLDTAGHTIYMHTYIYIYIYMYMYMYIYIYIYI